MVSTRALAYSTLVFRILVLLFLVASIVVMATNNNKSLNVSFKDLKTYRYVIATAIVGFVYTVIQLPFAIYYACTDKRKLNNGCLRAYEFYADKVVSFVLATGVGAGFAATYELKSLLDSLFLLLALVQGVTGLDEEKAARVKFLNRGYVSIGLLFIGFLCMAVVSVLTSLRRKSASSGFFG